jgi:hypothetical protein
MLLKIPDECKSDSRFERGEKEKCLKVTLEEVG